jgi:hypothetical protein
MALIRDNLDREFRDAVRGKNSALTVPRPVGYAPDSNTQFSKAYVKAIRGHSRSSPSAGLRKEAIFGAGMGGGGSNVAFSAPEIRNPLLNIINFYLPYDRRSLNQWIRYYDTFHPVLGNCMDLHGEFPVSDFDFVGQEEPILEFYNLFKENVDLLTWVFEVSREYELMAESYTFWNWNEDEATWDGYVHLNNDNLDVQSVDWSGKRQSIYTYELPREMMELAKKQDDERVQDLLSELDPIVQDAIQAGEPIPLRASNITELVHRGNPTDSRGRSNVLRVLKELLYEDKLREAQYAVADRQITPIQLWKLGDVAAGYMPTDSDLSDFRNLLLQSVHDPLFTIVSHSAIALDLIGFNGKLLPIIPEMDWVEKRILTGLFASKAIISGEGPSYTGAVVAMKALQGRYATKRERLKRLIVQKLLRRIAQENELYVRSDAELKHRVRTGAKGQKGPILALPEFRWQFDLDLTDEKQMKQFAVQLRQASDMPMSVLCEILRLDYNKIKQGLLDEQGSVFDSVYKKIRDAKAKQGEMTTGPMAPGGGGGPPPEGGGGGGGGPPSEGGGGPPEGGPPGAGPEAGGPPEGGPPGGGP